MNEDSEFDLQIPENLFDNNENTNFINRGSNDDQEFKKDEKSKKNKAKDKVKGKYKEKIDSLKIEKEIITPNLFKYLTSNNSFADETECDIFDLFQLFGQLFFENKLGIVRLEWSKRMKLCAGLFVAKGDDTVIRLSEPLLKFRSYDEIKETLLHEMIHAYLFIENVESGRDGHGPRFVEKMNEINKNTGLNITVYHSLHDEVDFYRTHIWKCNGSCNKKPPHYGIVKRSMNRAPSKNDYWWNEHQKSCGGVFEKIAGKVKSIKENDKLKTIKNVKDNSVENDEEIMKKRIKFISKDKEMKKNIKTGKENEKKSNEKEEKKKAIDESQILIDSFFNIKN